MDIGTLYVAINYTSNQDV